jgi:hypothetical protein
VAWRSRWSTKCFGGGWNYITGATTICAALTVTKSGGARRDIGSCGHTPPAPQPASPTPPPASRAAPTTSPAAATATGDQVEFSTPVEDDDERLDAYYDDEPLRYRTMTNIISD